MDRTILLTWFLLIVLEKMSFSVCSNGNVKESEDATEEDDCTDLSFNSSSPIALSSSSPCAITRGLVSLIDLQLISINTAAHSINETIAANTQSELGLIDRVYLQRLEVFIKISLRTMNYPVSQLIQLRRIVPVDVCSDELLKTLIPSAQSAITQLQTVVASRPGLGSVLTELQDFTQKLQNIPTV